MDRADSLVILPTYNEVETLQGIVERVVSTSNAAILIIDDGSPDGTGELANSLAVKYPFIQVIHRTKKLGLGTAYSLGFKWGIDNGFRNVIEMDSDGSHPVEMLPQMITLLEKNDLVIGSRYIVGGSVENWNLSRRLLSKYANVYSRIMLGGNIQDMTSGFRGIRTEKAFKYLQAKPSGKGFAFQIEMSAFSNRNKWKVAEFPINFSERIDGESKMSLAIKVEAFKFVTIGGFKRLLKFNYLLPDS